MLGVDAALRSLAFVSWREGRRLVVLIGGGLVVVALGHVADFGSAGVVVLRGAALDVLPGLPVCGDSYVLHVHPGGFPVL